MPEHNTNESVETHEPAYEDLSPRQQYEIDQIIENTCPGKHENQTVNPWSSLSLHGSNRQHLF